MELRQRTGVVASTLDNKIPIYTVFKTVDDLRPQGFVTPSGLVTTPLSSGQEVYDSTLSRNPIPGSPYTAQQEGETKEASKDSMNISPWWLLAGLLLL